MINIITEKVIKPPRVVLYGTEGVGKTTFGTQVEKPLFISTERGTDGFEVPRVNCKTWPDVKEVLNYLATENHDYKSLVIDTLDWAEDKLIDDMCSQAGVDSIGAFGHGKGYQALDGSIRKFLSGLDYLVEKGIAIYLLAHAKIERFNDPELDEPLDRWQMKCQKRTIPFYKEWADAVLFINHDRMVIDGKAKGGYTRKIWATHTAARDAKNRYNIYEPIEADFNTLNSYFKGENNE